MLNLSSNDYLGLAADRNLREEFLQELTADSFLPTSSSSRLLTGNFTVYAELEQTLAQPFGTEAALVFNSGYHANTGILPAVSDTQTPILADKLVQAKSDRRHPALPPNVFRYRHNDLKQLERFARRKSCGIQTGDCRHRKYFQHGRRYCRSERTGTAETDVRNVLLYVDKRTLSAQGEQGLGCAEETGCIRRLIFW